MGAHNTVATNLRVGAGQTETIVFRDDAGNGLFAFGTVVPSDAVTGYATGCIFVHTDGTNKTSIYANEGTAASADFNPILVQTAASALTAALTAITHTAPGTPDYAVQDLINTNAYGFVTKDEGNTVLSVIVRTAARLTELETACAAAGIIA